MAQTKKIPQYPRAFPTDAGGFERNCAYEGMTLRDYFAAHALQSIPPVMFDSRELSYEEMALAAYRMADAMLAARGEA